MEKHEVKYGWYSAAQAAMPNVWLNEWARPDGKPVTVTSVSETEEDRPKWDDTQFVGMVVRHLRPLRRPT
jgi:hypothetical protein